MTALPPGLDPRILGRVDFAAKEIADRTLTPLDRVVDRIIEIHSKTSATGLTEAQRWDAAVSAVQVETGRSLGTQILHAVRAHFEGRYRFEADWHSMILALFVLQAAVAKLLPRVFHVFLVGAPGGGKTSLLICTCKLTGGAVLGDVSPAALARATVYGGVIGIDEADATRTTGSDGREAREALVRDAYRYDAPKYVRFNAKTGEQEEYETFGPRVLASREDIDTATMTRGIPISCIAAVGEDAYPLLLESIWPEGEEELANRVKSWGDRISAGRTGVALKQIAGSEQFKSRVREAAERLGASREIEKALTMVLLVELGGLDWSELRGPVKDAIATGLVGSAAGDDQAAGDAMAALREILTKEVLATGGPVRVRRKAWLDTVNRIRRDRHDPPISSKPFGSVLRDAGCRDKWRNGTGNIVSFDIPEDIVAAVRGGAERLHPLPPKEPPLPPLPNSDPPEGGNQPPSPSVPNSEPPDEKRGASWVRGADSGAPIDEEGPSGPSTEKPHWPRTPKGVPP